MKHNLKQKLISISLFSSAILVGGGGLALSLTTSSCSKNKISLSFYNDLDGSTSLTVAQTHTLTITASSEYTGDYSWGGYVANQYPGILISVEGENHDILKIYNGSTGFNDINLSGISVSIDGHKNTIKRIFCPQIQTSFSYEIRDSGGYLITNDPVLGYNEYININALSEIHCDTYSWSGYSAHDNITFEITGDKYQTLKITNKNLSYNDISFSGITITNNNVKKIISQTITCDTAAIDYTLFNYADSSSSPVIVYGSKLRIRVTPFDGVIRFIVWGGFTGHDGISFQQDNTTGYTDLIINNNNTSGSIINFSGIYVMNDHYKDYIDETIVCLPQ